ncbi:MAG: AhpC/TSA family protein [Bacteroidetes bacterium]|nr:AhpC/TSA family protein [Bacteroidota bacterium]
MKLKLVLLLFFPLLLHAQQIKNIPQKRSTAPTKRNNAKDSSIPDALKNKKTMTSEELSKLGIELPGAWFTITGSVRGLKDSTQVFLASMSDGKNLAQGMAFNGQFKLHGQVEHEGLNVISFAGYNDFLTLFMANDSIAVTGDAGHLGALAIKGTVLEDDFVAYRQGYDADAGRLSELLQRINAVPQGTKKDSLISEYKKIVLAQADMFLIKKPASPIACFVLFTVAGLLDTQSELEERFDKLLPEAKKGMYAELIKRKVNENKVNPVGTVAPDFTQNDSTGKPFSLHPLRGCYVLIYFWAGWSKQCKDEVSKLVPLYEQYNKLKFSIIGVSLDSERDTWLKAVAENKMKWLQLSDLKYWDNEVARLYKIESIPQNILIGPDGKILDKNLTPAQLETKLALLCK